MTRGQIEFLLTVAVIVAGLGTAGHMAYETYFGMTPTKIITIPAPILPTPNVTHTPTPIVTPSATQTPVATPSSTPTPVVTHSQTPVVNNCEITREVRIGMTKAQVLKVCGAPERIDNSSPAVKRMEEIFKLDEIWYYDQQKVTVELTNNFVTAIRSAEAFKIR